MVLVASLTLLRAGIWAKGFPLPLRKGFPVWRPLRSVQFQAPALWLVFQKRSQELICLESLPADVLPLL